MKYRIVENPKRDYSWKKYGVARKRVWWPFWVVTDYKYETVEEAEKAIIKYEKRYVVQEVNVQELMLKHSVSKQTYQLNQSTVKLSR